MELFPGDDGYGDTLAFRAATEAVLGLLARGVTPDTEDVSRWLTVALSAHARADELGERASFFAERMMRGPLPGTWQPERTGPTG